MPKSIKNTTFLYMWRFFLFLLLQYVTKRIAAIDQSFCDADGINEALNPRHTNFDVVIVSMQCACSYW